MKRLIAWLLLAIIPWLSLQAYGNGMVVTHALDHEWIHMAHIAHHHDAQGHILFDHSHQSIQHLAQHDACVHHYSLTPHNDTWTLNNAHPVLTIVDAYILLPSPIRYPPQKPPQTI